jgi:peptidoglycan/xylan/chitin deacetylase (PgdA/CDA1 family)/SAM-dependent methyltransferase
MTVSADVIIQADQAARGLLRTADSLLRQRARPLSITLITSAENGKSTLTGGVQERLGAIVLKGSGSPGLSLNAALTGTGATFFVIVPEGYTLHETFLEQCALVFRDGCAAIAPAVAYQTPDGTGELVSIPESVSIIALLADTRSVPPVLAIRRDAWDALKGFDENLGALVEYEFLLRLISRSERVAILRHPLVQRELETVSHEMGDDLRVRSFEAVLDRNRDVVERDMRELLIRREIRFGQLRTLHREILVDRDSRLAELDRLRAEASHHRAYLQHHGRDAFDWGDFRRTDPVSREWGYDRGVPIDRRYIDDFLCAHSSDVRGVVLEVQEDDFTIAYGGRRVTHHDILDIDRSNARATVLADLRRAPEIESAAYDCIILTQTLHVIDDLSTALRECHRILKPGGVLLATFPAASRVCLEYGEDGDCWRMTPAGARALVRSSFVPAVASFEAFGNVLTNTAFLHGLGAAELTDGEFDTHDPYFPALTGVRAKKGATQRVASSRGVVLLYHRIDATPDVHGLGIPPDLFESHLQWLRTNCHVVSIEDLLSTPLEALPERAVALTFDDGYEDNLRVAMPLLERFGCAAAFFLTTSGLQKEVEYWWDTLERVLLQGVTPGVLDMTGAGISLRLKTATADDRRAAHWQLHDRLVHTTLETRTRAVDHLKGWAGPGIPRVRPMLADEVRRLALLGGVTIGAHTVNHLSLPDNADVRLAEMDNCQVELKRMIGREIDLVAYPYGAVDRETAAIARRAWRWGMSCDDRVLGDSFDAARVPRLDVKAWSAEEFAGRISRLFTADVPRRRAFTLGL